MDTVDCKNCDGIVVYDPDIEAFVCNKCKALHE